MLYYYQLRNKPYCVVGTNIRCVEIGLKKLINEEGIIEDSERGQVKELLNVVSIIKNPFPTNHPYWKGDKLDKYIDQFFKDNTQGFIYTYGERLLMDNQYDYVVNKLKENPNTRRAVMVLYRPEIDTKLDDIPCMNHVQFQIRNNMLFTTVLFRSHDIEAYYPNMCALSEVAKYIAGKTSTKIGEFRVYSNNLHSYLK